MPHTGHRRHLRSAATEMASTFLSRRHTGGVKAVPLIVAVFVLAVVLERADADTDLQFWIIVAAGIAGVVASMGALRARGGIGATGGSHQG